MLTAAEGRQNAKFHMVEVDVRLLTHHQDGAENLHHLSWADRLISPRAADAFEGVVVGGGSLVLVCFSTFPGNDLQLFYDFTEHKAFRGSIELRVSFH